MAVTMSESKSNFESLVKTEGQNNLDFDEDCPSDVKEEKPYLICGSQEDQPNVTYYAQTIVPPNGIDGIKTEAEKDIASAPINRMHVGEIPRDIYEVSLMSQDPRIDSTLFKHEQKFSNCPDFGSDVFNSSLANNTTEFLETASQQRHFIDHVEKKPYECEVMLKAILDSTLVVSDDNVGAEWQPGTTVQVFYGDDDQKKGDGDDKGTCSFDVSGDMIDTTDEYHDDGLQGQPDEHSNIKCVENSSSLEPAVWTPNTGALASATMLCPERDKWRNERETDNMHSHRPPYTCSYCYKTFNLKFSFYRHQLVHSDKKLNKKRVQYKCLLCNKEFRRKFALDRHVIKHEHSGNSHTYKCLLCNQSFRVKKSLRPHMISHLRRKEQSYKCLLCNRSFIRKRWLKKHISAHLDKLCTYRIRGKENLKERYLETHMITHPEETPYKSKCNICYEQFNYISELVRHTKLHTRKEAFECQVCDASFRSKAGLNCHYQSCHEKKARCYQCDLCNQGFTQWYCLKVHSLSHLEDRKYKCKTCGKGFTVKSCLNVHMWTHSDLKHYTCSVCGLGFNDQRSYVRHKTLHATEEDMRTFDGCEKVRGMKTQLCSQVTSNDEVNKPFQCLICGKRFKREHSMKNHKWIHTNIKPFQCEICGLKFHNKDKLSRHKWIHRDGKPFKCQVCDKEFHDNYSLTRHGRLHLDGTPYLCEVCGKRFKQKNYLHKHMFTHFRK